MDRTFSNRKDLNQILFIPFFKSLKTDDYESLDVTEEEYDLLVLEYFALTNYKEDTISKQMKKIAIKISILSSCLMILHHNGYDKDMIKILEDNQLDLYPDNVDEIIEKLEFKIGKLSTKFKVLKSQTPEVKGDENITAYDILANLSVGLEMTLKFSEVTVGEYISLSKALKQKTQSLKNIRNGRN